MAVATDRKLAPGPLKVEKAYRELHRMIVTHELAPGATLDERELMERLGIGRTPLREAMLRLAHERLIIRSPRRGAWVSQLSLTDIHQLNEVRILIEPSIARLAAERSSTTVTDRLYVVLDGTLPYVDEHEFEPIAVADLEYHSVLGKMSGNEYLTSFSREINTSLLRYWKLSFRLDDSGRVWLESHRRLLDLIAEGDADAAEREARQHIHSYRARMRRLMI